MIRSSVRLSVCLLLICCALPLMAQPSASADSVVPAMVKFTGTLNDMNGKPLTGTVGVTFLLYKEQTGGAPLWIETQNVQADKSGHYSVTLGLATSHGLPAEAFTGGEARWLGVQPSGQAEQSRVVLVSVPYALKALDAETLGGKPASAFLQAMQGGSEVEQAGPLVLKLPPTVHGIGTVGAVPLWTAKNIIDKSIITQSGTTVTVTGAEQTTGDITSAGNVLASTVTGTAGVVGTNSPNGYGVHGNSVSGLGVYGTGNVGIWGESTGTNGGSDGVHGVAHGPASGVAGVNDSTSGVGVWGQSPGQAFYANGNVSQVRTGGGWVKAMVLYTGGGNGRIVYCFNSTLSGPAATTPPCGFFADKKGTGDYVMDFGFEVDDRFISVTPQISLGETILCSVAFNSCGLSGGTSVNQVEIGFFNGGFYENTFYLLVY